MTKHIQVTVLAALLSAAPAFCADSATPGAKTDTIIATVGSSPVSLADLERQHPTALFQARTAFYDAQKKSLDDYIEELLLQTQAKKENVTVEQLIERHVTSTIAKDPDEAALRVYFEGLDTAEPFEVVSPKIAGHLRERRVAKARAAYIASLRAQIPVSVQLEAPRTSVSLQNSPVRGSSNAPLQLIEYADYECPYCQQFQPELEKLEAEYKGRLSFAFKDVPLPNHPHAQKAAEATRCAGVQNKYWEMHDLLLSTKEVDLPQLKLGALKLGLNAAAFDSCLDSGQQAPVVKADFEEAQRLGLQGTPSFLLNGRFFSGTMTYQQLRDIIEAELKVTGRPGAERAGR